MDDAYFRFIGNEFFASPSYSGLEYESALVCDGGGKE